MKFGFVRKDTLPRSSGWLTAEKVRSGSTSSMGHRLKSRAISSSKGAWDGKFSAGGFDAAITILGSGGKIVNGQSLVFVAPSHIYERLYSLHIGEELFVSNSLAFLLCQSGEGLTK